MRSFLCVRDAKARTFSASGQNSTDAPPAILLSCAAPHRFVSDRLIRSNLILLMRRRQLKVAELARIAGVNRSAVTALAKNRASRVELATLERICIVLDCQLAELLEIVPDDVLHAGAAMRDGAI
nr:helix-turn-helix transcriptional regulator [Paraburkholderia aspalathi]